jgi:beta-galactosidase
MSDWTRRDIVKTGLATSLGALALPGVRAGGPAGTSRSSAAGAGELPGTPLAASPRERLLLDFSWRFHLGHADDPARDFGYGGGEEFAKTGEFMRTPSAPDFDVSGWRAVDLPHDWVVELPFENDPALYNQGFKPVGRAHPATSIGWYRRVFEVPASDRGRRLSLEFDGVFRDCLVALNGIFLGRNLSGYAPFRFDVTEVASYGGPNVLVVRADATEHEGWFYEGGGIYRHTWLVKTHPVHVAQWGTYVSTEVHGPSAELSITTQAENEGDEARVCRVVSTVTDTTGHVVATAATAPARLAAWSGQELTQRLTVRNPSPWSVETPALYRLTTVIEAGGVETDRYETPFGIRTMRFDPDRGFFLNGTRVELKGTCNHQDHAGVGSALPDRLQSYRVEKLKGMGCNAYRTSHNPPTPELLDACDRLGMLVLDETRMMSSSHEGLSQFSRMVRRDRNHPCVFAWSIGNEEWRIQGNERGALIAATMKRLARRLDPSRPVTEAMNSDWGKGLSDVVDIQGFNYFVAGDIDVYHRDHPRQPTMGTETASTLSTRGIYANDETRGYLSAYDVNVPRWGSTAERWWSYYDARRFLAGGFVWTGFDYRGEPTPYKWPCISSHFGILDTCGFPKDNYFYYQAWWGGAPVLHLFPHWNWAGREGQEIEVWCHSNLERVELFLNGSSLGTQDVRRDTHLMWKVPYTAGTLEAHGYRGGQVALTVQRETTGPAARVLVAADRPRIAADGEDVAVVEARVVDSAGRIVPVADDEVSFRVSGAGRLIGVGNGDPSSHEADRGSSARRAFNGLCMAIVQATKQVGEIHVEATAPGLAPGTAVIRCEQATPRPAVA